MEKRRILTRCPRKNAAALFSNFIVHEYKKVESIQRRKKKEKYCVRVCSKRAQNVTAQQQKEKAKQ